MQKLIDASVYIIAEENVGSMVLRKALFRTSNLTPFHVNLYLYCFSFKSYFILGIY